MGQNFRRLTAFVVGSAAFATLISACGTPAGQSTTTTTTSTTLPSPVAILATGATGSASFEGQVLRVAVAPLGNGVTTLPVRPPTQRTVTGTVKIGYRQFGSGPNLVLAMGEHGSMTWWDPQFLNQLAQSYRVTIFDYPEVGYSTAMSRPPSVETDGDVLAGLIASLGLTNTTVLGWGMGGEAALSFVERHPGMAIGLVLVDTTAGGASATRASAAASTVISDPTSTMQELAAQMFPTNAAGAAAEQRWLTDIATVEPDDVTFGAARDQAAAERAFMLDGRLLRLISKVDLPTLIYQGAKDVLYPEANARTLHRLIGRSQLVIDTTGGYAALFQNASTFVANLNTFMTKVSAVTTTTTTTTTAP